MNKSQFACQQTLARFRRSYLWTFTFRGVLPLTEAISRWHRLQKSLTRYLDFRGVRVFELHPGGHGMHVHVVTDNRYEVDDVRPISDSSGFGRIHVELTDNPDYVSKYVTKGGRSSWPKGTRLWASFGRLESRTRVRDVEVDSLGATVYRGLSGRFYVPPALARKFALECFRSASGTLICDYRAGNLCFWDLSGCLVAEYGRFGLATGGRVSFWLIDKDLPCKM